MSVVISVLERLARSRELRAMGFEERREGRHSCKSVCQMRRAVRNPDRLGRMMLGGGSPVSAARVSIVNEYRVVEDRGPQVLYIRS